MTFVAVAQQDRTGVCVCARVRVCACMRVCEYVSWSGCLEYLLDGFESADQLA